MKSADKFPEIPTTFIETLDSESFKAFLHALSHNRHQEEQLLSFTLPIAPIDPLAALELHGTENERFFWDHPRNNISISAAGKIRELKSTGISRFDDISKKTKELKKKISAYTAITHSMAGPLFLGGYSFGDHNISPIWKKFGAARFILPEWTLVKTGDKYLLTLIIERRNKAVHDIYTEIIERVTDFLNISGKSNGSCGKNHPDEQNMLCNYQSLDEKKHWVSRVEKAKEHIFDKDFEKIVLARTVELKSKHPLSPTLLSYHLRQSYPECYNFIVQVDENTSFIGATPERLAAFEDGIFKTEGLAGSASRGKSASEDAAIAQSLMRSEKDLEEHQFVVRAIDDSLSPYSYKVDHPNRPQIKKLSNVQHLFTPISASIKEGVQIHELLKKLHPTPAVGGYPKIDSVPYIMEIEQIERGWYSAPVGWYNLNGCGEFAVAIRSALLYKNRAHLYAGCGIVSDSDPESEWEETIMKFEPMTNALNEL